MTGPPLYPPPPDGGRGHGHQPSLLPGRPETVHPPHDHLSYADPARGGKVRWVADAPRGALTGPLQAPVQPYTGPPSYPAPPRWGFPNLVWRLPTMVPGTASTKPDPADGQRALGIGAVAVLTALAVFTTIAGAAELWRYGLLVQSRDSALNSTVVALSDGMVLWLYLLTVPLLALAGLIVTVAWLLLARTAAARLADTDPPRSARNVLSRIFAPWLLLGVLAGALALLVRLLPAAAPVVKTAGPVVLFTVFVVSLVFAGPVAAELEHAALGKSHEAKIRPSRLVIAWWLAWVGNSACAALTIGWRMRDGLQTEADSVLLTAVTDLTAAALAVLTVMLIRRIMALLAPPTPGKLSQLRVVTVRGAPDPPLRVARPAGARR
ncbi:MAG: DUF4328 domain-containing protein [Actinophytocola sp.]|nr:DUF4328 domain-containing protein [Actinophytocola sp.]